MSNTQTVSTKDFVEFSVDMLGLSIEEAERASIRYKNNPSMALADYGMQDMEEEVYQFINN